VIGDILILKAFTVAENVVSDVENMVRFIVGIVQFEKMKTLVNRLVQFQPLDQQLHRTHPAIEYAAIAIREFIINRPRIEHGAEMLGL
jgi:hypothetical protein